MSSNDGRFKTWLTTKPGLIFRKALIAFVTGFGGVMLPAILQILDQIQKGGEPTWESAIWISLIAGAFAAGIRALLAISPINLSSTDALTSWGSDVEQVTVKTQK